MSNSKGTKRSLLASLTSLLLCVAMLIGSTFAWFTDTASTAVNKIQAGNLNVELWKGSIDDALGTDALKWVKADGHGDETVLWEPGATYNLESFRIKNNGDLDLKYKVIISGLVGNAKLLEAIDFTVSVNGDALVPKDGTSSVSTVASLNNFEGTLEAGAVTGAITIKGHMKEEAGNEYQGLSIDGIGITVVATQYTYEYDSNDNQYDKDAPVYTVTPETAQAVLDSIEGYAVIQLTTGDYGTLYFRQSEQSELYTDYAKTTHNTGTVANGYVGYGANQSHVDALYLRKLSNVTIVGCDGATVDNIKFMIGYYKYNEIKTDDKETISGNVIYKDYTGSDFTCTNTETNGIYSFIEVENMTIKNVNFSGKRTVLSLSGNGREWCTVNGMHFINCSMNATETTSADNMSKVYFLSVGKATNNDIFKNFSLENCTITGATRVMTVCGIENLSIIGNKFTNIIDRDLHIHADGTTSTINKRVTGTVVISNNTSDGSTERFIRVGDASQMYIVITDNTVTNYKGADGDYIKVTGAVSKKVSGNTATAEDGRNLSIGYN